MRILTITLLLLSNILIGQDGVKIYLEKPNLLYRQTIIIFLEGSTDGFDNCCDAVLFGGITNRIYTYNGNDAYSINTFAPLTNDKEIQLGMYMVPDTGLFIIGIDQWYGDTLYAQLIDNLIPGLHQLPYTCYAPVSNDRFKILFEYPMFVEVYNDCDYGMIVIDNDDEGSGYVLQFENDTTYYPSNIDTIQNLSSGIYTLISGSGETYMFEIQTTQFEASIHISSSNVLIIDSSIEFVLTCFEPLSQIEWNFGDGTIQYSDFNPVHQYTQPGIYEVIVTLTSFTGCQKIIENIITVSNVMGIPTIEKTRTIKVDNRKWMIDGKQIE